MQKTFLQDFLAGLTVSFAALSLGAAFGTMSGRGAFAGMIAAAVIPIVTSLLGGTRLQASGPTAPMTAVTATLVALAHDRFPDPVLAEQFITLAILLSGALMILAGALRLGKLVGYIPNAVVLGFMNGIATLIWFDQIGKLAGLAGKKPLSGSPWLNTGIALATLALIFGLPALFKALKVPQKLRPFLPGTLLAILLVSVVVGTLRLPVEKVALGSTVSSLGEFLALVGRYFPGREILTPEHLWAATRLALQLLLLGYLDSLLTALVVDRMTRETTNRNRELIAQGLSNIATGLVQGIPGAQATIRSVLLLKEGAQTRAAGVMMGALVLIFLLFFKDAISLIPAAVFAGVLIKAGWDVSDRDFLWAYVRRGWRRDPVRNFQLVVITLTTLVTVLVDLNVAVLAGCTLFFGANYFAKDRPWRDVEVELEAGID
jgi:SulP family sulfate permease